MKTKTPSNTRKARVNINHIVINNSTTSESAAADLDHKNSSLKSSPFNDDGHAQFCLYSSRLAFVIGIVLLVAIVIKRLAL